MKLDLNWQKYKWCAVTLIVFGQRKRAITMFEDMLRDYPEDSYALGSIARELIYFAALRDHHHPVSGTQNQSY